MWSRLTDHLDAEIVNVIGKNASHQMVSCASSAAAYQDDYQHACKHYMSAQCYLVQKGVAQREMIQAVDRIAHIHAKAVTSASSRSHMAGRATHTQAYILA